LKRFVFSLLALSIFSVTGAHLPLLQVAAWAGMIVSRSAHMPVAEAIRSTFDGGHPCRMCCAIRAAQRDAEQGKINAAPNLAPEVKLVLPHSSACLPAVWTVEGTSTMSFAGVDRSGPPPVPPPRC
jgi:hypothetical protein